MKKMLASDYDHTFYINDEDIKINKGLVKKFTDLGNVFVIATGRSYFDLNRKLEKYKFEYDYAILNHGATIIDKNNNVLLNIPMSNKIVKQIKEDLALEKSISSFCCSELESRVDFNSPNLTKINVKYNSKEEADTRLLVIKEKYGKYVNAYCISFTSIEIISKNTNKAVALNELIKSKNIDRKNVYTIGDGYSDIEMVQEFNGYCMEDAVEDLKMVAKKEVTNVSVLIKELLKL